MFGIKSFLRKVKRKVLNRAYKAIQAPAYKAYRESLIPGDILLNKQQDTL